MKKALSAILCLAMLFSLGCVAWADDVTGGFHGEVRIDGSGTGDAFVFGHLAGEKMAEAVVG